MLAQGDEKGAWLSEALKGLPLFKGLGMFFLGARGEHGSGPFLLWGPDQAPRKDLTVLAFDEPKAMELAHAVLQKTLGPGALL